MKILFTVYFCLTPVIIEIMFVYPYMQIVLRSTGLPPFVTFFYIFMSIYIFYVFRFFVRKTMKRKKKKRRKEKKNKERGTPNAFVDINVRIEAIEEEKEKSRTRRRTIRGTRKTRRKNKADQLRRATIWHVKVHHRRGAERRGGRPCSSHPLPSVFMFENAIHSLGRQPTRRPLSHCHSQNLELSRLAYRVRGPARRPARSERRIDGQP